MRDLHSDIAKVGISNTAMAISNDLATEVCTDISERVLYYLFVAALAETLHKPNQHMATSRQMFWAT